LSISDIDGGRRIRKTILIYTAFTLFCVLFSIAYEHFSHGVYSNYMIYLFAFPLAGGVVPAFLVLAFRRIPYPTQTSCVLYNCGLTTLTVGSCLKGVLEIYGTISHYILFYWFAGFLLIAFALIKYLNSICKA